MRHIVVLDAGTGNVRSALRAFQYAGADVELTANESAVMNADGLVVPGVGAFGAVMEKLRSVRGDFFIDRRLAGARPVFGICVGLQIMFDSGTEYGIHEGLGQWRGKVEKLPAPVIPHMGWSPVDVHPKSEIFKGIQDERFYFVHSYGVLSDPATDMDDATGNFETPIVSFSEHGARFVAAVENGPLVATQFHPEKSGDAGIQLIRNWLDMV